MKVIIMAAGKGTRISRHINGQPKCMLDINQNISLIKNTLNMIIEKGITDIVLVTGYKSDMLKEHLKDYNIKIYENLFYNVTNSVASLWFAREELKDLDRVILLNGDVFVESSILDKILKPTFENATIYADSLRIEEADYKLKYSNRVLEKYGKDLRNEETTGEYIGIIKLENKEFINLFSEKLHLAIVEQKHDLWWENILFGMNNEVDIKVEDVKGNFWAEIDYIEDYLRIVDFLKKGE